MAELIVFTRPEAPLMALLTVELMLPLSPLLPLLPPKPPRLLLLLLLPLLPDGL